jgi:hypothetical protein
MNCPSCNTVSSFLDYELLNQSDRVRFVQVLFWCSECRTCFTKRFSYKHSNPAFMLWFVTDLKSKCVPAPDKMKFRTERGFVI